MDRFFDIDLRPDPEFAAHILLGALYSTLHRELVSSNTTSIAVSFPGHQTHPSSLGTRMRLIGSAEVLRPLTQTGWMRGIRDHVNIGALTNVPDNAVHRPLRRIQAKSNPARIRRRLMKRHSLDEEQAKIRIPDGPGEMLNLPFVQFRSQSTGQAFRLFLRLGPPQSEPSAGVFNTYGLSQSATVPWF